MNWLCNSCGYENEYKKGAKIAECLCCGEPAPMDKPVQMQPDVKKTSKESIHYKSGGFIRFIPKICGLLLIAALFIICVNVYLGNISVEKFLFDIQNMIDADALKDIVLDMKEIIWEKWLVHYDQLTFRFKNLVDRVSENISLFEEWREL